MNGTNLCSHSVRARGKQFGDACSLESCLRTAHGGTQASTTRTHYYCIVFVVNFPIVN